MTSAVVWSWHSASHPCHFTPGERAPQYPLDWRLGGLQRPSGYMEKWKFLTILGLKFWLLSHPAHSQLLYQLLYGGSSWYYNSEYCTCYSSLPLKEPSGSNCYKLLHISRKISVLRIWLLWLQISRNLKCALHHA
jgi:hypothetical protein